MSCAGNIRVKMDDCDISEAEISRTREKFNVDKRFTAKIWSYGIMEDSATEVQIKDVLREQGLSCVNIKYIRFRMGQSFWDQIFSIVPFIQRTSLRIEVMKTEDAVGF